MGAGLGTSIPVFTLPLAKIGVIPLRVSTVSPVSWEGHVYFPQCSASCRRPPESPCQESAHSYTCLSSAQSSVPAFGRMGAQLPGFILQVPQRLLAPLGRQRPCPAQDRPLFCRTWETAHPTCCSEPCRAAPLFPSNLILGRDCQHGPSGVPPHSAPLPSRHSTVACFRLG